MLYVLAHSALQADHAPTQSTGITVGGCVGGCVGVGVGSDVGGVGGDGTGDVVGGGVVGKRGGVGSGAGGKELRGSGPLGPVEAPSPPTIPRQDIAHANPFL